MIKYVKQIYIYKFNKYPNGKLHPVFHKDVTFTCYFSPKVFYIHLFQKLFFFFIIVCLIVWFYDFPTGYAHFLLGRQCALFLFDASSQKPLSPFLP